jgi:hypothetical protein
METGPSSPPLSAWRQPRRHRRCAPSKSTQQVRRTAAGQPPPRGQKTRRRLYSSETPETMNPFHQLLALDALQWPSLHRRGIASARGRILRHDHERLAATDELVALTVPLPTHLGSFALLADTSAEQPAACMSVLSRKAADVLRLLDCALAADGRNNDYPAAVWLGHAFRAAHTQAVVVATSSMDEMPLTMVVEAGAVAVADVIIALPRDRLGVPEALADALGALLVLYFAGTEAAN